MSFGYSIGDGILLAQLAGKTLQGARKACGEHDELTREVASLHRVLQRLQKELANPDSLVNRVDDDRRRELNDHGEGCETVLNVMNSIVTKYNKLSNTERSGKRLWQKIKFGNGEMKDLADIRLKLSAHTSAITVSLNLCSLGSQGRVEKQLSDIGGDLHGIRGKVNWIAANMTARSGDGTVWTSYENDDKSFWRQLRRELVKEGYRSSVLHKYKGLLKDYVEELGRRGAFDQVDSEKSEDEDEDEDTQGSMESEDDFSAVTESEGSEPEDSDLDPVVLNDKSDQLEEIAGPDPALEPENLPNEPSPPHPTPVQLLDMSGQDPSVFPISPIEPSVGVSSSADELPSKPDSPASQTQNSAAPRDEFDAKPLMIPQSVRVEEVLDEDFLLGAHPNCFTDERSLEMSEDPEIGTPRPDVAAECFTSINTISESCQGSNKISENNVGDFVLLSSMPPECSAASELNKISEQTHDNYTVKPEEKLPLSTWKVHAMGTTLIIFEGEGFKFAIPRCTICKDVMRLIKRAFPQVEYLNISAPNANHYLLGHANGIDLPELWLKLLPQGWSVTLQPKKIDWLYLQAQKAIEQLPSTTSPPRSSAPHPTTLRMPPLPRARRFHTRLLQCPEPATPNPSSTATSASFNPFGPHIATSSNDNQNSIQNPKNHLSTGHIVPPLPRAVIFQASDRYIGGNRSRKAHTDDSSENDILSYFSMLTTRRKDQHAANIHRMTERAEFYYHARPHPAEIAAADAELKRGIDEDWKASVQRYPEALEHFHGLVDVTLPGDDEPGVRDPPLSALGGVGVGREVPTSPISPPARSSTTQIRVPSPPTVSSFQGSDREEATSGSDWSTEAVHKYTRTVPRRKTLPRASTFQAGGQSRGQAGEWRGSGSRLRKEVISESSDEEVDSSTRYVLRTGGTWRSPDLPRAATFQAAGLTPLSRAAISQVAGPPPLPKASTFQAGEIGGWGAGGVIETASSRREARRVLEWQEQVARSVNIYTS